VILMDFKGCRRKPLWPILDTFSDFPVRLRNTTAIFSENSRCHVQGSNRAASEYISEANLVCTLNWTGWTASHLRGPCQELTPCKVQWRWWRIPHCYYMRKMCFWSNQCHQWRVTFSGSWTCVVGGKRRKWWSSV
jgi:hypothetical protein